MGHARQHARTIAPFARGREQMNVSHVIKHICYKGIILVKNKIEV